MANNDELANILMGGHEPPGLSAARPNRLAMNTTPLEGYPPWMRSNENARRLLGERHKEFGPRHLDKINDPAQFYDFFRDASPETRRLLLELWGRQKGLPVD